MQKADAEKWWPGGRQPERVRYLGTPAAAATGGDVYGTCKSACTLVLGAVPRDRICVTPRAKLGFHAAYVFDSWGRAVMSPEDTGVLWANYPQPIRNWLTQHGGLTVKMIYLSGRELSSIYPACGVPADTGSAFVHGEIHPAQAETKSINPTHNE